LGYSRGILKVLDALSLSLKGNATATITKYGDSRWQAKACWKGYAITTRTFDTKAQRWAHMNVFIPSFRLQTGPEYSKKW